MFNTINEALDYLYSKRNNNKDLSRITEDVTTKAVYEYVPKEDWGTIIR